MRLERHDDPVALRDAVEEHLLADEPRHNLLIGLLGVLVRQPDVYPEFRLWRVADDDGRTLAAALRTPPHLVVVSSAASSAALETLGRGIAADDGGAPGVMGALPEAEDLAGVVAAAVGRGSRTTMRQRIHVLERVEDVPVPPGAPRAAGPGDLQLVLDWSRAFHSEAGPNDVWDEEQTRRRLAHRLAGGRDEGVRFWEDDGPVCLAGFTGPTRTGIRVGPVYTPPDRRRRGYATALVAHVSREQLASGRRFCFLYTDVANLTSNAIYRTIGYRPHCESAMIRFV